MKYIVYLKNLWSDGSCPNVRIRKFWSCQYYLPHKESSFIEFWILLLIQVPLSSLILTVKSYCNYSPWAIIGMALLAFTSKHLPSIWVRGHLKFLKNIAVKLFSQFIFVKLYNVNSKFSSNKFQFIFFIFEGMKISPLNTYSRFIIKYYKTAVEGRNSLAKLLLLFIKWALA